jgi:Ca2+-binding RTX toxin-like protein
MAGPQILNLGNSDHILRKPGDTVSIDQDNDAVVVAGDQPILYLDVYLGGYEASDLLGVHTEAGKVELPGGLAVGAVIRVDGVEIGTIFDVNRHTLMFDFNVDATDELIQKLIRSLTYKDESTETGFTSAKSISLTLTDSYGRDVEAYIAVCDSIQGTDMANTFMTDKYAIGEGDELDGGMGDDILRLTGGEDFRLDLMSKLTSVETLEGSSASDNIWIRSEQLEDLRQIDGKGHGAVGDKLSIFGTTIDLTDKTISGFDIRLESDGAEITVDGFDLAQHVYGYETDNDTLILKTGTLSDDERLLIHRHGIDTIVTLEDNQITTHEAPYLTAFGEGAVNAERGELTFLDIGRNAGLSADDGLLRALQVSLLGDDPQERLGIDASNGIALVDSASSGTRVFVDGIDTGELYDSETYISVYFNGNATPALVQKVVQSLTYRNDGEGGAATRQVTVVLYDPGLRETTVQFDIDLAASVPPDPNLPPTDISLQGSSVLELAANGSRIGDLSATDAAGSSFAFQILKADGTWGATDGRFTIEGSQLKVANGLLLDHEQAKSHTIKIKVTDGGGLSYEKGFVVTVGDVNPENAGGSAGSDSLVGGSGDDTLNGLEGADHLVGGAGNDTYFVDNAGDRVVETDAGGTADEVRTTVSYTLAAYVERLTASGSAAINLTGNALSNRIKGNAAGNKIDGGNGDDMLAGGAGNDRLTGGKGKDVFVFDTAPAKSGNKDKIIDWSAKHDTIQLENAIFKSLKKTGGLSKSHFVKAAKALDGNDYVGYDARTGNLWYDHNGSKAGGQLVFAHIGKHKIIAANDFLVI